MQNICWRRIAFWVALFSFVYIAPTEGQDAAQTPRVNVSLHHVAWTKNGDRIMKVNKDNKAVACAIEERSTIGGGYSARSYIAVPLHVCFF